jgi:hypothetical protein
MNIIPISLVVFFGTLTVACSSPKKNGHEVETEQHEQDTELYTLPGLDHGLSNHL